MARSNYRPLLPRTSANSIESKDLGTTSAPGEPLVRIPAGKPRCPPAISRLRVEKVEGGLAVAGVVVAANCQIVLPIFGFLFMLVGCVLTAASYRGCGENEEPDHYAARIAFTGNSRVLGPVCIVAGALMTIAGIVLCILMRAAQRRQRRLAFHCPIHGDFYPVSPQNTRKYSRTPSGLWRWLRGWLGMEEDTEAPRCPRSTEPASPARADAPCPPPLPFLVPSDSVVGMASVLGAPLSPEQAFGSIKSLAISREVASFPLSRSPTPPLSGPLYKEDTIDEEAIPNAMQRPNFDCGSPNCNYRVVECKLTTNDEICRNTPLKTTNIPQNNSVPTERPTSIPISMPNEGKG